VIAIGSRTATLVHGVTLPARLRTLAPLPPAALARYPWIDRGAYAWADLADPADLAALATLVAHVDPADPRREIACARVIVLEPGDYILAHHDPMPALAPALGDSDDDAPLELVIDVSPAPTPGAELYYRRRGAAFLAVPAVPGTLAIVERGPAVTANHAYVSKRHAGARVVRVVVRAVTSARRTC
jgi:hypothetical protein